MLGTIPLRSAYSVYEARKKIYALAEALGFDSMTAVRIASATSQLCRSMTTSDGSAQIELMLREIDHQNALVMKFTGCSIANNRWMETFFDKISTFWVKNSDSTRIEGIRATKMIPTSARTLNEQQIESIRQRIERRSREELMQEIQAQYEALARHSAELEQTVTDRTEELRKAMESADAANRAKSEFLSNMSHELRTPLNGVLGYSQILQRDPNVTPRQRTNLEAIQNCGQHLLTLINDVLDLSKIEAGKLELDLKPCDLPQLLRSVYDIVRPRAESRELQLNLTIDPNVPRTVITDNTKLKQTLLNLAGNAVKFTEKGSVDLRARCEEGAIVFEIQDTGLGMTDEESANLFQAFKQGEGGKKHGGTGLGLAITKRIIEALGGSLAVTSAKGVGSTFTIRLPRNESEAVASSDDAEAIDENMDVVLAPGQNISVLIADDVFANRDILTTILNDAGFKTVEAENGQQAVDLLRQHRCPIALMDLRMPVMDGIEAVKAIRADPDLSSTKVIVVTASVIDFKDKATAQGFDDLVGKPIHVPELLKSIQKHLGVRFVSRKASAPTQDSPSDNGPVKAELPKELIDRLRAGLKVRNLTAINALSAEICAQPGAAPVGQRIADLTRRFDFKGLESLVSELEALAVSK